MKYRTKNNVFIRKETQLNDMVAIVYSGDKEEMYEINEAIYDVLLNCDGNKKIEDIVNLLHGKYNKISSAQLHKEIENVINMLMDYSIVERTNE